MGYQSAFGMWTGIEWGSGQLSSHISLPLEEAPGTYSQSNSVGSGVGTHQYAPQPPRGSNDLDFTAIMLMSYIYPATKSGGSEMSGIVCRLGNFYFWHNIQVGNEDTSSPFVLAPDPCPDNASSVAFAHTHPEANYEPNWYPSGYWSAAHYHDADPNTPGQQWSDLKIADKYFDEDLPNRPQPKAGNATWYLAAGKPGDAVGFMRYKKTSTLQSKDNPFRFDFSANQWVQIQPRW